MPAILSAMQDKLPGEFFMVQQAGALALGRIGVCNKEVVAALVGLLDSHDDASRSALVGLGLLGSKAAQAADDIHRKTKDEPSLRELGEIAVRNITGKAKPGDELDLLNSYIGKRAALLAQLHKALVS